MTIGEARAQGILDKDLTTFTDLKSGKIYSIQEAIDSNFLVATLDNSSSPAAKGEFLLDANDKNYELVLLSASKSTFIFYNVMYLLKNGYE